MVQVDMHEATTRLSQLVGLVEEGERVVIARNGVPVAELVPAAPPHAKRRGGQWQGKTRIATEFDAPMRDLGELFNS